MFYTHTIRPLKGVVPTFYLKPMEVRQSSAARQPRRGAWLVTGGANTGGG